ncbi:CvpA family protein [Acuticoccus kandeliae]|uniref:CvpA family protein n=1 Tax=Acuticoccus kandeliae TaxID=2073160 RepID=UPI000D3E1603|nr:CvpA family protein [Acuticoccus kandeliae]
MNIAILDGVVIAVVLISALLAMFRGFVREVLSIAAWVAAAILAYLFYEDLLPFVSQYVDNRTIAIGVSAAAIFLVSLIIVSLITMKISDFVMDSPVGALDRLIGFVFGAARGLLLVVVAVIFFNWLVDEANRPAWVTTAVSYERLSNLGEELLAAIPDDPEAAIRGAFEPEETTPASTAPATPAPVTTPAPATTTPAPDATAPTSPAPTAPAPSTDTSSDTGSSTVAPAPSGTTTPDTSGTTTPAPDAAAPSGTTDAPANNGVQN